MSDRLREVPLSGFLAMLFTILVLPPIGIGWGNWIIDWNTQKRVEEIQAFIQRTDESINMGKLEKGAVECVEPDYVETEHYRDETLVARDAYVQQQGSLDEFRLVERTYYVKSRVIARDTFGPVEGIPRTVKWRQYYNSDGQVFLQEYFTQGGIGLSKEYLTTRNRFQLRKNFTRSPFPPISVTFLCYR
jgi:hypothetical protein